MEKKASSSGLLPPTILLVSLLAMLGLHFLIPASEILPLPWNLLGLLPLILGIGINLAADSDFKRAGTTVNPFGKPSHLVTGGPFRISRNPMYLGFVLVLVGVGMLMGSLTPFGVIPFFIGLINARFIRIEEQNMAASFGQEWEAYKAKVRRWL